MGELMRYRIGKRRICRAYLEGMEYKEKDRIRLKGGAVHRVFFPSLDNYGLCRYFGQFHMQWELPAGSLCRIYALVRGDRGLGGEKETRDLDQYFLDDKIPSDEKKDFFCRQGALEVLNVKDMLLYEKPGRYLWLLVEITGEGEGEISHMEVLCPGDNFMQTFPEIYQETGGFFHRYLSVLSTVYRKAQRQIEGMEELLDLNAAPAALLPMYGQWLGIDVSGGFLGEDKMREILKQADSLNRGKGTRQVILRITQILIGEFPMIVERALVKSHDTDGQEQMYDRLYGKSSRDVVILIKRNLKEAEKMQIKFMLDQFEPIGCRLRIITLNPQAVLDGYCYLDENAQIPTAGPAVLDENASFSAECYLPY